MLIIAHRGYSGAYPENTIRAFKTALDLGAQAIELDVHLCKDKQLIVTHDYTFGRTVKASGSVGDYTAAELAQFDAGSFKNTSFHNEKIPLLNDVLKLINNKCLLNIEIKTESLVDESAYEAMTLGLLKVIKNYGSDNLIFSSFNHESLKRLRQQNRDARIAVLDDRRDAKDYLDLARSIKAEAYNVALKRINKEQVLKIQKEFKVYAYTVKNESDLQLAKDLAVDGIFADNLEEAIRFL